jgi:meiotically up-regulated gene 157 (Mug157) protein
MICSIFRPSDDATIFPFLIPSNLFAVTSLRQLADIQIDVKNNPALGRECREFADEVEAAVYQFAVREYESFGKIFAYEADGFGNRHYMDDANVPSLLSIPYLTGLSLGDDIYRNTRRFVLSETNPYYFKGNSAAGIGGPHTGMDMIWPLGLIMRALTSRDDEEIRLCLKILKSTHAGTGFMHESFHKDDPSNFTRKWFAWANTLFGELILKLYHEKPTLLSIIY